MTRWSKDSSRQAREAKRTETCQNEIMKNSTKILDYRDEGVQDLMRDSAALKTWEFMRGMGRTTTVEEMSAGTGLRKTTLHEHVDHLLQHGLIKMVRARKPRNSVGYRSLVDRLVISYDEHDESVTQELIAFSESTKHEFDEIIEEYADQEFHPKAGFRFRQTEVLHLTQDEFAELRRRMLSVVSFLTMPRHAKTKIDESGDGTEIRTRFCNQAIKIELTPLTGELLPKPSLIMSPRSQLDQWDNKKNHSGGMSTLTPREHQVAMALADGFSRAQIAARMEISVNTVSTLTQRAYKKIGVTSQAQLAARITGHDRPAPGES